MSPQIQQVSVKLFLMDASSLEYEHFIPIFHAWIREKRISDHLLIDVADYQHVPNGPGVMLIADEAHYGIDSGGGEPGFLYSRKRDSIGDAKAAMQDALRRAAVAAAMVEAEPRLKGTLKFRTDNVELRVMSRLTAPNTAETRATLEPVWSAVLGEAGFVGLEMRPEADPRNAFGLRLMSCASAPDLATLSSVL